MSDDFDVSRVTWVWDPISLSRLMAVLKDATEVSWDLETTGLNEYHKRAKIVLASFTVPSPGNPHEADTWLLPLYHPESPWLGSWRRIYRDVALLLVGKFLMAHNGKFDCRWTNRHTGVDLSGSLQWDTRVSSHSLDENRSTKLKVRAPETFDVPPWDDFDLSEDEAALRVPLIDLGLYAARDTYWTWRLAMNHRVRMFTHEESPYPPIEVEEIEDARLGTLSFWCTMPTTRTLTAIEQRGIALDIEWVQEAIAERVAIRDEEKAWLVGPALGEHLDREEAGLLPENASFAPTSHWFRRWTEAQVSMGNLKVTSMTKNGNAQWNKAVLIRQQRAGSEVAERLLRYRAAVKQLEFLNAWLGYVRDDGAIHCQYNVGSLITGRLSSQAPNMQQITKILRPAFVPRKGYVIADFDYSQIELRVAAFLSRCIPMIEAFQRGDDLHTMLAGRITSKMNNLAAVTPDERQAGKSANFGLLYEMSAAGFRIYAETVYDVAFTREESEAIHRAFFDMWTGMREWHIASKRRAHQTGQVVSPIGRVRRLPGIFSNHDGKVSHAERQAINSPVQGLASDLMQIAAAIIEGNLPGYEPVPECRLVATVHDSIVGELPEDNWEEVAKQVIDRMTNGVLDVLMKKFHVDFDVPIVAEATVGTRWGLKDVGELAG
jgi:DNA polymerase I-like protein with 3'-5' exonuclease and polymerase domains